MTAFYTESPQGVTMIDIEDLVHIQDSSRDVVQLCAHSCMTSLGVREMAMSMFDTAMHPVYPEIREQERFKNKIYFNPSPCSGGRKHWFVRFVSAHDQPQPAPGESGAGNQG